MLQNYKAVMGGIVSHFSLYLLLLCVYNSIYFDFHKLNEEGSRMAAGPVAGSAVQQNPEVVTRPGDTC